MGKPSWIIIFPIVTFLACLLVSGAAISDLSGHKPVSDVFFDITALVVSFSAAWTSISLLSKQGVNFNNEKHMIPLSVLIASVIIACTVGLLIKSPVYRVGSYETTEYAYDVLTERNEKNLRIELPVFDVKNALIALAVSFTVIMLYKDFRRDREKRYLKWQLEKMEFEERMKRSIVDLKDETNSNAP